MNTIRGNWNSRRITIDGNYLFPHKSQAVYNHSPDGFSWGYGGSGPAQLALAILLEFTDKRTALQLYQNFKKEHIAKWPQDDFAIEIGINKWIEKNKII